MSSSSQGETAAPDRELNAGEVVGGPRVRVEGANVVVLLGDHEYSLNPATALEIGMQLTAAAEAIMNAGRQAVWVGEVLGVRVAVLDNGARVIDADDFAKLFLESDVDDLADKFPAAVAAAWPTALSTAETLPAPAEAP